MKKSFITAGPESIHPQYSRVGYSNSNCTIWPNSEYVQGLYMYISKFDQVFKRNGETMPGAR